MITVHLRGLLIALLLLLLFTFPAHCQPMVTPPPSTILPSGSVTFFWGGLATAGYWLEVGTTAGDKDIFDQKAVVTGLKSQLVTGIPTTGQPIFVQLWTLTAGKWTHVDYSYTAAGGSGPFTRLVWYYMNETLDATNAREWWLYIDVGTPIQLTGVTCALQVDGIPECKVPVPALTPGSHVLTLSAKFQGVESARSDVLTLGVVVTSPSNLKLGRQNE